MGVPEITHVDALIDAHAGRAVVFAFTAHAVIKAPRARSVVGLIVVATPVVATLAVLG